MNTFCIPSDNSEDIRSRVAMTLSRHTRDQVGGNSRALVADFLEFHDNPNVRGESDDLVYDHVLLDSAIKFMERGMRVEKLREAALY